MQPQPPNPTQPMIEPTLITATPEESRVLFADDLGSKDENVILPFFQKYGPTKISTRQNQQRTFGYIEFPNHESASLALKECNYTQIGGRLVHLYWADEQTKALKQERKNTVILKNIDPKIDIKALHEKINSSIGEVINVTINTKQSTNAYLQFRHLEDAVKFVDNSPIQINGNQITVEMYKMPSQDTAVTTNEDTYTKIYFNGLPENYVNEESIKQLIGDRGLITEFRAVGQQAALATLENHEQAVRCVTELNHYEIDGKKIEVSRALTKSEFNRRHPQPRGRGQYNRGGYQPRGGFDRTQSADRTRVSNFRGRNDMGHRFTPHSESSVPPK